MPKNNIAPFDRDDTPKGVCVADGHGIKIRVERQHLVVDDGFGRSRRSRSFHKATGDLERLVVLGTTGYLSLEAVRWLADAKIPLIHIDTEGRLLTTSLPMGADRAALRRAQALALGNGTGLQVMRYLLDRKLEGQAHLAEHLGGDRAPIDGANRTLEQSESLNELMWLEAQAANHYWHAWTNVECQFITKDHDRVPEHWRTFGKRASRFGGSGSHNAANPINAILNYLYALLEAEAIIACQTVGLDPGTGILHVDKKSRDSFALDLMEPSRPWVDRWVLRFLDDHRFKASDFTDTRRGTCRLKPTITHWLAESTAEWADAVSTDAAEVVRLLTGIPIEREQRRPIPPDVAAPMVGAMPYRESRISDPGGPSHCHICGADVPHSRKQCDPCLDTFREQLSGMAHARLDDMRSAGQDPAHGGQAAKRRGVSVGANNRLSYEWNRNNERRDRETFATEILPLLADVPLSKMAEATGLSKGYCSFIKRGMRIPHERHWGPLSAVGEATSVQP